MATRRKRQDGEARPAGGAAVRSYTREEWAERERRVQEIVGARLGREDVRPWLTVRHDAEGTRVAVGASLPPLLGAGASAGQVIELELDAEHVRALVAACERVLASHGGRAVGAATVAMAHSLLTQLVDAEVG